MQAAPDPILGTNKAAVKACTYRTLIERARPAGRRETMKVRIEFSGAKDAPGEDYEAWCDVKVDGKSVAQGGDYSECPEDANLGRGLKFVYGLPRVLQAAHEAGRRGEPFELEEVENVN